MADSEFQRSLNIKTEYLLREYQKILHEFLPQCSSIDKFAEMFSTTFITYQDSNLRKMDPASIREGKVSCSSAAALLGTWWLEQFPQLTPIFLVEQTSITERSKPTAHVNVALPTHQGITSYDAVRAFYDPARLNRDIHLVDWTQYSKMKPSNPNQSYAVYAIHGLESYVRNRVAVLGLPKKYSTKRMLLGSINVR
jgi:hypothetical protein